MEQLRVYRNDVIEWVIAESPEEAAELAKEYAGEPDPDWETGPWRALPDDDTLAIEDEDLALVVTKTCAEWVASNGRGFLASTEY